MAGSMSRRSPLRVSALPTFWRSSRIGIATHTVPFTLCDSKKAVFVLHVFQKKSKRGVATPKADIDLIRERLKVAERMAKELSR